MPRNDVLLFLVSITFLLSVLIFMMYGDIWPEPARRSDAVLAILVLTVLIVVLAVILLLVERAERLPHRLTAKAGVCLVPEQEEESETVEIKGKIPENSQQTL